MATRPRILRRLAWPLGLAALALWLLVSPGQVRRENLDLPYDAARVSSEDEEEAPHFLTFYGQQYEGDGIFYVVDRSGSMGTSGELRVAKREVIRGIRGFSRRIQFAVIFFGSKLERFPESKTPVWATAAMRGAAISFVVRQRAVGNTCVKTALIAALDYARNSSVERNLIILLTDGGGTCHKQAEVLYLAEVIRAVRRRNRPRCAEINTVGVLEVSELGERFLRELAELGRGRYVRISR